jgi:hypothetical protein
MCAASQPTTVLLLHFNQHCTSLAYTLLLRSQLHLCCFRSVRYQTMHCLTLGAQLPSSSTHAHACTHHGCSISWPAAGLMPGSLTSTVRTKSAHRGECRLGKRMLLLYLQVWRRAKHSDWAAHCVPLANWPTGPLSGHVYHWPTGLLAHCLDMCTTGLPRPLGQRTRRRSTQAQAF